MSQMVLGFITSIFLKMDSCRWGPTLEDALTRKSLPMQIFLPMKEINKHIPKVANSSMSPMTLIKELLAWKLGKIHIP